MDRYLGITNIKMLYVPFKSRSLEKLARAGAQPNIQSYSFKMLQRALDEGTDCIGMSTT